MQQYFKGALSTVEIYFILEVLYIGIIIPAGSLLHNHTCSSIVLQCCKFPFDFAWMPCLCETSIANFAIFVLSDDDIIKMMFLSIFSIHVACLMRFVLANNKVETSYRHVF